MNLILYINWMANNATYTKLYQGGDECHNREPGLYPYVAVNIK